MEYQEYPKWVKVKDADDVLVHDAEEEAKLTGKSQASLEKQAEKNAEDSQEALDASAIAEVNRVQSLGTAVTEADIAKMTDPAFLEAAQGAIKRGPGRPKKDVAASPVPPAPNAEK